MGLSLSSLNPVKIIKDGLESVTGISDQRRAINAASQAQRQSILQAITGIQEGGASAANFLNQGADSARNLVSGGGAFDVNEFGQGLTLEGYGNQLASISDPNGAFAPLIQDRMTSAQNMLGAAGLTRSGNAAEAAASIPMELAMGISDKMFGRQSTTANNLGSIDQDLYGNLANLELSQAANIANLETGMGQVEADRISSQGAIASPFQSIINSAVGGAISPMISGAAGAVGGAASAGMGALLAPLIGMFSDERLKQNMKIIGRDREFTFYSWDWIPEVEELGLPLMNHGLIAQDVEKIAPEYVFNIGSLKAVNYDELFKDPRWSHLTPQ